MNIIVIAQHHGAFLTLQSLFNLGYKDIDVLVPESQQKKYAEMWAQNQTDPNYAAFKDFTDSIDKFCKKKARVFIIPDFDIKNTINSTLCFLRAIEELDKPSFVLVAGTVVTKKFDEELVQLQSKMGNKMFAFAHDRMYNKHRHLDMYHMIGLPKDALLFDTFSFFVNGPHVDPDFCSRTDKYIVNAAVRSKNIETLPREFNHRHDPLIGAAISARETLAHNAWADQAIVINYWAKAMAREDALSVEEIFGYPLDTYALLAKKVKKYLPLATYNNIMRNGKETEFWARGLIEVLYG